MPTPRGDLGAAAAIDGKIYVPGGTMCKACDPVVTFDVYDPRSDAWGTRTPMPSAQHAVSVVVDGNLYALGGGAAGGTETNTVDVYDPNTDTWTSRAPFPRARWASGVTLHGEALSVSGRDATDFLAEVDTYDAFTDSWTPGAPISMPRLAAACAEVDGRAICTGGYTAANTVTASVEAMTCQSTGGGWTKKAPMAITRAGAGVAFVDGRVFAAMGDDYPTYFNQTAAYDPNTDAWSARAPALSKRSFFGSNAAEGTASSISSQATPKGSARTRTRRTTRPETRGRRRRPRRPCDVISSPCARTTLFVASYDHVSAPVTLLGACILFTGTGTRPRSLALGSPRRSPHPLLENLDRATSCR